MSVSILYALDRLRHRRSRAEELADLRRRFRAVEKPDSVEAWLADELRQLRKTITTTIGKAQACAQCARNAPLPNGRFSGGFCCGGTTEDIFSSQEIAALRFAGTRPVDLGAPRSDHAGCVFRGSRGCSLHPEHRPNICVRYLCRDLLHELKARGILPTVDSLCAELDRKFDQLSALRIERQESEPLENELRRTDPLLC